MVRFLERVGSLDKLKSLGRRMHDLPGRHAHSMILESENKDESDMEDKKLWRSQGAMTSGSLEGQQIGSILDRSAERPMRSRLTNGGRDSHPSDMELMKERFAKLLLGEDMSGGGKGVSSALALSNAITNLAASVFGEQSRLEPMPAERKARWRREIDWLLSVTDHIVEFVPSQQLASDGTNMEIMVTQQRKDLHMNIPALRKLDAMLLEYLDNFKDHNEFWYVKKNADECEDGNSQCDEKWWHPTVKVPPNGLSEVSRKWLLFQKELVNQVLKAAMAINANVLMEMEIPEAYIDSLPKNGRASLGDSLYRSITVEFFDPEEFLSSVDLSTEHKILDLKNRIEASIVIWKRKMNNKDVKATWGLVPVSMEKREQFEDRAETILLILKHRFPGIPQSSLDVTKIQYTKDVGLAVLESYSRILETLAFTVMSRIEDVLHADSLTQNPSLGEKKRPTLADTETLAASVKILDPQEEIEKLNKMETSSSMTLSDFMGWHFDQDTEEKKKETDNLEDTSNSSNKPPKIATHKKPSYIEKLEILGGLRSPTSRQ